MEGRPTADAALRWKLSNPKTDGAMDMKQGSPVQMRRDENVQRRDDQQRWCWWLAVVISILIFQLVIAYVYHYCSCFSFLV